MTGNNTEVRALIKQRYDWLVPILHNCAYKKTKFVVDLYFFVINFILNPQHIMSSNSRKISMGFRR